MVRRASSAHEGPRSPGLWTERYSYIGRYDQIDLSRSKRRMASSFWPTPFAANLFARMKHTMVVSSSEIASSHISNGFFLPIGRSAVSGGTDPSFREDLRKVVETFKFECVAARVEEEHRRLLAHLARETNLRFDHKFDAF